VTTPEGKIEKYLVKRVHETGGKTRKLKWIGHNGAPDRLIWWPPLATDPLSAFIFFVEVKAPGKKPTAQQTNEHKKMMQTGLTTWTVDTQDSVEFLIECRYK